MRDLLRTKRKGVSIIETVGALIIFGLLAITVTRIASMKLVVQADIDAQYAVLAADGYMADIYSDFHKCSSYSVDEYASGQIILTFTKDDGENNVYSFDPTSEVCMKNGAPKFKAKRFTVDGTNNSLVVTIKLPDERLMDFNIFR